MKKLILLMTFIILCPNVANALENSSVMNLHTNEAYVVDLNARPMELQNSNPRIVKTEAVTDIYPEDSSLLINTFEEGISYVSFKLNGKLKTVKILIDDKGVEDEGLTKLDKIEDNKKE